MQHTLPTPSRSCAAGFSGFAGVNTYGQLSDFLRGDMADEDARLLSESMQQLAAQGEVVVTSLRLSRQRERAAPLLMDMLTVLRAHRSTVANLGFSWRGLYEYAAYLQALDHFRLQIGEWLLATCPWDEQVQVNAEDFALLAWRTLGEGVLLVDMYEQWLRQETRAGGSGRDGDSQPERVQQWWHKLRR